MGISSICITGAGNGIGRGIAEHFHRQGWQVFALDRDAVALAEIARERLTTICCDVSVESEVRSAFAEISSILGNSSLTALVNNAAVADPFCGPLEDLGLDEWRVWIDASLTATFLVSREALPLLRRDGNPRAIVNISSTRALQSEPETFAYAASKGGVSALTHAMAVSLGPEIRVNAVLPGWIETGPWQKTDERTAPDHRAVDMQQHPVGRVGRVEDIANAVDWLISDRSGFVTGQQIVVDGGMTVKMIYAD